MKRKRIGLIPKIIVGFLAVYAVVNLVRLQLDINDAKEEHDNLSLQVEQQKRQNEMLKESADKEADNEQIAEAARSQLGLVSPGERVFVDISN